MATVVERFAASATGRRLSVAGCLSAGAHRWCVLVATACSGPDCGAAWSYRLVGCGRTERRHAGGGCVPAVATLSAVRPPPAVAPTWLQRSLRVPMDDDNTDTTTTEAGTDPRQHSQPSVHHGNELLGWPTLISDDRSTIDRAPASQYVLDSSSLSSHIYTKMSLTMKQPSILSEPKRHKLHSLYGWLLKTLFRH